MSTGTVICGYCPEEASFQDIIKHLFYEHPNDTMKFRERKLCEKEGKSLLVSNLIDFVPNNISYEQLKVVNETRTVIFKLTPSKSPAPKRMLHEKSKKCLFESHDISSKHDDPDFEKLMSLLPDVMTYLKDNNKLDMFLNFMTVLHNKSLPLDNIAFLLFMDVVKFYSCNTTRKMKYNPVCKKFWHLGRKLFHGKFINFMSGYKHLGALVEKMALEGNHPVESFTVDTVLHPSNANINFAVPSVQILRDYSQTTSQDVKPGILAHMLQNLMQNAQGKPHKICVDGKKLNHGGHGKDSEIDLFGYEGPPTLQDRYKRLETELHSLDVDISFIEDKILQEKTYLFELSNTDKISLCEKSVSYLCVIAKRLRDVRNQIVKKCLAVEKFKKLGGADWKKSKYCFIITSLQVSILQMKQNCTHLLKCTDAIMCCMANMQGNKLFCKYDILNLSTQENYYCLKKNIGSSVDTRYIKQKTDEWLSKRKEAKVTGSTIYSALGLDTLKQQLQHFDKVIFDKDNRVKDEELMKRFEHGTANEINAIATLVGKILPSLYPSYAFIEEGFYEVNVDDKPLLIVSPDGSVRCGPDESVKVGLEFKCPMPGKTFTTDVFYEVPVRYVSQLLAEMFVLQTDKLLFLCWNETSTTVFEVHYDGSLWHEILQNCINIYGGEKPKRPSKVNEEVLVLRKKMKKFVKENTTLIAEVPSVSAVECKHDGNNEVNGDEHFHSHKNEVISSTKVALQTLRDALQSTKEAVKESHERTKNMCTEVLVWVASDIYRHYKPEQVHALPVAYALKGYSLPTNVFRKMHTDMLINLTKEGLYVPVSSYDGQWAQLAIKNSLDEPLTLLQLQKQVFQMAKKEQKSELLKTIQMHIKNKNGCFSLYDGTGLFKEEILNCVHTGYRYVGQWTENTELFWTDKDIQNIMQRYYISVNENSQNKITPVVDNLHEEEILPDDCVFNCFTEDIQIDEELERNIHEINASVNSHPKQPSSFQRNDDIWCLLDENEDYLSETFDALFTLDAHEVEVKTNADPEVASNVFNLPESYVKDMMTELQTCNLPKIQNKWKVVTFEKFKDKLCNAHFINSNFTLQEVRIMIEPVLGIIKANNIKICKSWTKKQLVNVLSMICGDCSKLADITAKKSPKTPEILDLAAVCMKILKNLSKHDLNCIYAAILWPRMEMIWKAKGPFHDGIVIPGIDDSICWYSQPQFIPEINQFHFDILDPHHLLTNCRYKVCTAGMPRRGINKNAWHKIANDTNNQTGLSRALVEDVIDRQSSAYALKTFSLEVQEAMKTNGNINEAEFCSLMLGFHEAADQPGIPAIMRIKKLLALKKWLLKDISFSTFPPPGMFVNDMSVVEFEGLMTNIERRIQLFAAVPGNHYNARALGSLDSENFFSCFQDLHAAGSGILKPKEVPAALATACEILATKMDTNRGFSFVTSTKKVYPQHEITDDGDMPCDIEWKIPESLKGNDYIVVRNDAFDNPERKRGKQKRKRGEMSSIEESAKGAQPIRQYYKVDETKILLDKRMSGLNLK